MDKILNQNLPEILYHYTTQHGLYGIAKSKTLWCSSISFLNDGKEFLHAIDLISERLDYRINAEDGIKRKIDEVEFLEFMKTGLNRVGKSSFFLASFSEEGNLLSQWRAYSKDEVGISIGFATKDISKLAYNQGFKLIKCIYDPGEKYKIVDEYIDNYLKARINFDMHDNVAFDFAYNFSSIASILKHDSFYEEKEWRLISNQINSRNTNLGIHTNSKFLVPHYDFNLKNKDGHLEFKELFIGPGLYQELVIISIKILLEQNDIRASHIIPSMIPYRSF